MRQPERQRLRCGLWNQPGDHLCGERVGRQFDLGGLHVPWDRRLRLSGERELHDRPRDPVEPGDGEFVIARVHRPAAAQELRILNPQ